MSFHHVRAILGTRRPELQVQQHLDRSDFKWPLGRRKRVAKKRLVLGGQVIDHDAVGLNGHSGLHRHQPSAVVLEGLVANEEVHAAGRPRVAVGPHGQATDDPVANAQAGQFGRSDPHRIEHAVRHDALEQREVRPTASTAHAPSQG
ncbi:MAG: hypothetical protein IT380_21380 [Myxococcales bacterium]|nr:hypothetical protein [Myxococcales bacterium]